MELDCLDDPILEDDRNVKLARERPLTMSSPLTSALTLPSVFLAALDSKTTHLHGFRISNYIGKD